MTEEELLAAKAKTEGARVSYTWLKRHLADFDQSEESAKKIGDYLTAHGLAFNYENLEQAFLDLKSQGVTFTATPAAAAPVVLYGSAKPWSAAVDGSCFVPYVVTPFSQLSSAGPR